MDTQSFFEVVSYKHVLAVVFSLMCFFEIRRGFLSSLKNYLKSLSAKPLFFLTVGAFLGAMIFLPFDAQILKKVQNFQSPVLDQLIFMGAFWGRANGAWGPLAALYLISALLQNERLRNLFFGAVLSSALTGLIAHIIKFLGMRARPYNDLGPLHFFDVHGFVQDTRAFQSFPSGDVAIAAGAASFLFLFLRQRYFSWVFLLIPFFTALSRIDLNKHWPSDAAFSFFISFTVAKFTLDYFSFSRSIKA